MVLHIAASAMIGVSLWAALLAAKTDSVGDWICAGVALALGIFFFST